MLTNITNKTLLKMLVLGSCTALLSLASPAADALTLTEGTCLFTTQLTTDPAVREAYDLRISMLSITEDVQPENSDLYITSIEAGAGGGNNFNRATGIDRFSNDCLSCHDGVMAKDFNVRIKNNPQGRVMSLEDIIGGHPVGMEYETYVAVNSKEYRQEVTFSKEMMFVDGRVGCLTCHNPLNTQKGHLVMNNERSELCFSCHNK